MHISSTGLFDAPDRGKSVLALIICIAVFLCSGLIAWLVQMDFGKVEVTNDYFQNEHGVSIRAKLFRPKEATSDNPVPGVVFVHGYESVRETGDGLCIELSRRGFVAFCIDAIGRGDSDVPGNDPSAPTFDNTFGGRAALRRLKSLPFVKRDSVGMMGHSLGAEIVYNIALRDTSVKALAIIGFAYTSDATPSTPRNMLMIIGGYDEFRDRMTKTRDIQAEWMGTTQTKNAIAQKDPLLGVTYGDFKSGSARRVLVPPVVHILEPHSKVIIAEVLNWMKAALNPDTRYWKDPDYQIWSMKESATLAAMLSCFASLLPLGIILLGTGWFSSLRSTPKGSYACSKKDYYKFSAINGMLMWLYIPSALTVFGIHRYVVRIDRAFPMMMVNAVAFWFVLINIIGFFLFRRWLKDRIRENRLIISDLGISFDENVFRLDWSYLGKACLFAAVLFLFSYCLEYLLEAVFIVDFRFIFAFANDLTQYRALMFLLYFPFFLFGFIELGFFLHGQIRRAQKKTWRHTFFYWSGCNLAALIVPLVIFASIQYVPLFITGAIPLVGPGGMFVLLVINIFHMIGVLFIVVPISTWFYRFTGRPYVGSFLSAALVTWMFTSSQVIAPIPI
jgi:dienelactone hydrolase